MEVTGYDYIIYSQVSIFDVVDKIQDEIKKIWPNAVIRETENVPSEKLWLFVGKDKIMIDDLTKGYELDENGEGCFSIIGSSKEFEDLLLANIEKGIINCEIRFLMKRFWSYTLVLPALIHEDPFSAMIYNLVINVLEDEYYSNEDIGNTPKPVQYFFGDTKYPVE
ncbi:hypothetical protein [Emticicia fontis]